MSSNKKHLAVIFSDLQIHDYKQYNKDGKRLGNCLKVLFDIGDFCAKHGIKTVLHTGDFYDQKRVLPIIVINETVRACIKFAKKYPDITIYLVSGNHGLATKSLAHSKGVSAIQHLSEMLPDTFKIIDNKSVSIDDNLWLHGIPYYEYPEDFDSKLQYTYDTTAFAGTTIKNYLLIHQTPRGIGNSIIPHEVDPKDPRLECYDYVFCGHIHKRQQLTNNFLVVGSPIHRDAGDLGEKKGFIVMNLYKPANGYKFIPLKGYPEFKRAEDITDEDAVGNFVIPAAPTTVVTLSTTADTTKFNTGIDAANLVENYWGEVDGKDKDLLEIGLLLTNKTLSKNG